MTYIFAALFTRQMLIDARACGEQVELFDQHFPKGSVNVTVARAKKLATLFDWDWAQRFLDAPALADYDRNNAAARADHDRISAPARADYNRIIAAALADYKRISAPAWADHERIIAAAWADYKRNIAAAWAQAYIDTCKRKAKA